MSQATHSLSILPDGTDLWRLTTPEEKPSFGFTPPVMEIDGQAVTLKPAIMTITAEHILPNGFSETCFTGAIAGQTGLELDLIVQQRSDQPVMRFCYRVRSSQPRLLTRSAGRDAIDYLGFSLREYPACREVRFSEFDESIHSFRPVETNLTNRHFENSVSALGPLLVGEGEGRACLVDEHLK
jgi:hypothetical protein